MGIYAASGAIRVTLDDATTTGLYMPDGSWRINTTDIGPGIYAPDGALRGTFDDTAFGFYDATGAIRMSETKNDDGQLFVVIAAGGGPSADALLLETGTDYLLLEDGSSFLLLE